MTARRAFQLGRWYVAAWNNRAKTRAFLRSGFNWYFPDVREDYEKRIERYGRIMEKIQRIVSEADRV